MFLLVMGIYSVFLPNRDAQSMPTLKKFSISLVVFVYIFSYIIYNFVIGGVRAESTSQHTNIVAVFVDKDIYNTISSDIQRYASSYIQ